MMTKQGFGGVVEGRQNTVQYSQLFFSFHLHIYILNEKFSKFTPFMSSLQIIAYAYIAMQILKVALDNL